jgi:LAO/AO transport system kinase
MPHFSVYLLRCADDSYYAGHTDDLERRIAQHEAGEIEGFTQARRPVTLVWQQETATREEALAAEMRIKGWSRAKKEALIAGDWERLKALARSKGASTSSARTGAAARAGAAGASTSSARTGAGVPLAEGAPAADDPRAGADTRAGADRPEATHPFGLSLSKPLFDPQHPHHRRAIAKAITLIESTRAEDRARADALLDAALPRAGKAVRVGISGVPGVGKSTFIESLGLYLADRGHRIAVLAVDPSSSLSGGSILGDKTRMERLSVHEAAFIRPSPASGTLGGVAEKTRETMLLCEAAGFDVVIVETVGVGQSETAVAGMTDCFVLLQLPNAGDDLQAIKKGVMELADVIAINKADIDEAAATRARAQITSALRYVGPHAHGDAHAGTPVLQLSALTGQGIDALWSAVQAHVDARRASGAFDARRRDQAQAWMWERIEAGLKQRFHEHPAVRDALPRISDDVKAGRMAASVAARRLLDLTN